MSDVVSVLDGNLFLVSDGSGDVDPSSWRLTGLISFDTRFLSRWVLTLDGARLHALSVDDLQYFESRFFLVPGEPTHYVDAKVSVFRQRSVAGSFREQLTVLNHRAETVGLRVRMEMESDFADISEIRNFTGKRGVRSISTSEDQLRLSYQREEFLRETVISSTAPPQVDEGGMTFDIELGPHASWSTELQVTTLMRGARDRDMRESLSSQVQRSKPDAIRELTEWIGRAPQLTSNSASLRRAYHRSIVDLAALRYHGLTTGGALPATGLPWQMTVLGRHGMLTCLQTLPFLPELTPMVLLALAIVQGTRLDDFRDEEPGKILHEVRYGESAGFEDQPHSPYYGAADTTPLFVILLDEYERWSGDVETVRKLRAPAYAALNWIDTYGNMLGDGYVRYQRRNERQGLLNQCWKDSWDGISYADGRLPDFPRATCELQGYAYDAKIRGARLARTHWNDPTYANQLEQQANDLKTRFNKDFWLEEHQYYALGLDPDGNPIDALASNMGHLLWSGIINHDRAPTIANHLLGPDLFSGWGVRTLAQGQGRYNPIGYHVGTVWPFDNSFIAWGLRRYGLTEHAGRIAQAIIDASQYFDGRLPEAFAGYDRELTKYPVQYPTASSPHSSSAGAVLLLIRVLLGLEPHGEQLITDPVLPSDLDPLGLADVPGRWGRADAFGHNQTNPPGERPLVRTWLGEDRSRAGVEPQKSVSSSRTTPRSRS